MKIRFLVCALTLVLVFGLSGFPAQAVSTPSYLGQTTWTGTITASTDSPEALGKSFTITGGITRVGDIYYLFQGYRTVPQDNPHVFSGSGVLLNGQLTLTCSSSHLSTDGDRNTDVMNITLNQSDLNGSFFAVGHHFTGTFEQNYNAGTLTRTGPAINLTPGVLVGPTSLLLLEK
jgi:hypothetical protein